MRLVATIAFKDLGVELARAVSRDVDVFNPTRLGDQIARVESVSVTFALGTTCSPAHADERVKLLAHHAFQHHMNGTAGQVAQILPESWLARQWWGCLLWR